MTADHDKRHPRLFNEDEAHRIEIEVALNRPCRRLRCRDGVSVSFTHDSRSRERAMHDFDPNGARRPTDHVRFLYSWHAIETPWTSTYLKGSRRYPELGAKHWSTVA